MFIDTSYFSGPLTIAQLGQKAVVDSINDFINRFEPLIMEAALGYDFYQAFLDGLDVSSDEVIDPRWLDLLNGVTFPNINGIKKRFAGFAGGQNSQTIIASQRDDLFIYAGVTLGFASGGASYINSNLTGWNFDLELIAFGTLEPFVDWNYIPGGGVALNPTSPIFHLTSFNERWVLHFTGKKTVVVPSGSQNLLSPLAGFIYYEYMKDMASSNTGIGYVVDKGENSSPANVVRKPIDAFNEGVKQVRLFWELMQADQQKTVKVYPEFDPLQVNGYYYGQWNSWAYWLNSFYGSCDDLYSFHFKNVFGI